MDFSTGQQPGGGDVERGDVTERVDMRPPQPPPPPSPGIIEEADRHPDGKRGKWITDEVVGAGGGEDEAVVDARYGSADNDDLDSVNCFFLRGGAGAASVPPAVVPCSIHLPAHQTSRPILVGYAFGPKKMSTMGIIMAEASKALDSDYFGGGGEHQDPVVAPESSSSSACVKQWTCDQPGGDSVNAKPSSSTTKTTEDEATIVTCSTSASGSDNVNRRGRSQPCRRLTTAALEEENSRLLGGNGRERGRGGMSTTASLCSGRSSLTDAMGKAPQPHRQISLGSVSGRGGPMTATTTTASYFSSAASHYSSCPSVATASVVGGVGGGQMPPPVRVSFVPLDLDCPLEEQHGGNFDVILHKLTEDILSVSKSEDGFDGGATAPAPAPAVSNGERGGIECSPGGSKNGSAQAETMSDVDSANMISKKRAEERLSRLARYVRENRSCCLVDHPDRIRSLMSRADIATVLSRCLQGVVTRGGVPVRSPRFLVCRGGGGDDAGDWGGCAGSPPLVDRIDAAPFTYPLIAKPLAAAGTAESHKMVIVLGREGLGRVAGTPCILQEYLNHDGRLFKVYVLGDDVRVFERTSLPNLPRGEMMNDAGGAGDSSGSCQFVEFDSQKPYPKLSDFGVNIGGGGCASGGSSRTDGGVLHDEAATVPRRGGGGGHDGDDNTIPSSQQQRRAPPIGPAAFVTGDEIRPVATALRKAFSLELFGFDVLVSSSGDEEGGECGREMLVVDVNYFPSYKEVSNFPSLLARYLTQRAVGSRQGKRKR